MHDDESSKIIMGVMALLMVPFAMAWRGYVLSLVWAWFVMPLGVPAIGIAHAIGLSMTIAVFAKQERETKEEKSFLVLVVRMVMKAVLVPLVVLAFAAIVHEFM